MKIYKNRIKIRWSDLDPNMHLANSGYMNLTSSSRMVALEDMGLSLHNMHKWGVGPVIFTENFQFFREVLPGAEVVVHTQISGLSKNAVLFEFEHNIYDTEGDHKAKSKIFGCWMDLKERKIAKELPEQMQIAIESICDNQTRELSMMDIKNLPDKQKSIDKDLL